MNYEDAIAGLHEALSSVQENSPVARKNLLERGAVKMLDSVQGDSSDLAKNTIAAAAAIIACSKQERALLEGHRLGELRAYERNLLRIAQRETSVKPSREKHHNNRQGFFRRLSSALTLGALSIGAGNADAPVSSAKETSEVAATPIVASAPKQTNILIGVATFYGNEKDMFGYVRTTDEQVTSLLKENGKYSPDLPEKVIAADYLTAKQMLELFKTNPVRYALMRRDGSPYDPREAVIAMAPKYLGKKVLITNPRTGASTIATVGDTGNFSSEAWAQNRGVEVRIADLSAGVAQKVLPEGKGEVEIKILE